MPSICLVGETNINRTAPLTAFDKVRGLFDDAEFLFGHMECPISDRPSQDKAKPDIPYKPEWVLSTPENAAAWKDAGFDAVSTASNVSYGESIVRTVEELDRLGLSHAGTGRNIAEARRPAVIEKNGFTVGFLSYTSVFWPFLTPALKNKPGAATVRATMSMEPHHRSLEMPGVLPTVKTALDLTEKAQMINDIAILKQQTDFIVVSCHWGVSNSEKVCDYQVELAHSAIDAGANVVMGHHPHRPQGIELYQGKPVFYSMGNFAFDWCKMAERGNKGFVAYINTESELAVRIVPVYRGSDNQIAPADGTSEGDMILQTVRRLSEPFGVSIGNNGQLEASVQNHKEGYSDGAIH